MVGVVMVGGIAFIAVVQHHLENVSPGQIMLNSWIEYWSLSPWIIQVEIKIG